MAGRGVLADKWLQSSSTVLMVVCMFVNGTKTSIHGRFSSDSWLSR